MFLPAIKKQLRERRSLTFASTDAEARMLRSSVASLPDLRLNRTEGDTTEEWLQNRIQLRESIMTKDPRRFIQWEVVRKSMFVGSPSYIATELSALRSSGEWQSRWRKVLNEDPVGAPDRCRFRLSSSGNLIHHAYSLFRFEQLSGKRVDQFDHILEFGGGYGSLCRLVHRLGFQGEYLIFDLPELSALQRYFLTSVGVLTNATQNAERVACISDLELLKGRLQNHSDWLFIALWSLSEAPVAVRADILGEMGNICGYLLAYQDRFADVDNQAFFNDWMKLTPDVDWFTVKIQHLPQDQYLFGNRSITMGHKG